MPTLQASDFVTDRGEGGLGGVEMTALKLDPAVLDGPARPAAVLQAGGEVAKAYGVVGPAGLYANRWTFYVDADGKIAAIDKQVSAGTAGRDIARRLGELGFPKKP